MSLHVVSADADSSTNLTEVAWQSAFSVDHPLVGSVYSQGKEIDFDELLNRMTSAKYLLIGEKHDNADHHELELSLLRALKQRVHEENTSAPFSVVMEMLDSSQQDSIDALVKALSRNPKGELDGDALKAGLDWPAQGWRWPDYADLIGFVINRGLPLYAGNLDRDQMLAVYRSGIDAQFDSARALRAELAGPLLDQVYDGHCQLLERESLGSMVDVQLVKDAAMTRALTAADTRQSVLIAGAGHIRKDSAVPRHLRFVSAEEILTVALLEVDPEIESAAVYQQSELFDVLIFTPVANQRDYCAELKKSMGKE